MIQWCAYCQTYMGEKPPFEDYAISHGMCKSCAESNAFEDNAKIAAVKPVKEYFDSLWHALTIGDTASFQRILPNGLALGIKPVDFAIGVLQPLLYQVGELWSRGNVTVSDQHFYSAASGDILRMIHGSLPGLQKLRNNVNPKVLLIPAAENMHVFGLMLVEVFLILHNIPCRIVPHPVPDNELDGMLHAFRPAYLGVSVAMPQQLGYLPHIAGSLKADTSHGNVRLFAGGFVFRSVAESFAVPGCHIVREIGSLEQYLV